MKKPLITLLALTAVGATSAQSTVTVFGVVDAAISMYRAEGTGSRTLMSTGAYNNSRLGFRGVEDLGGGMSASFEIEAGFNNDSGSGQASNSNNQASGTGAPAGLTFNRRSTVSLAGNWGELRLGRDYTPSFWNLFVYDPFRVGAGAGAFTIQGGAATVFRASNSVGYFTPGCSGPVCKGFYGQVMVGLGENASGTPTSADGRYTGVRAGYGAARFDVNAGTGLTKGAAAGDFTQTNVGASYDFGVVKLMGMWGVHKAGVPIAALGGGTKATHYMLGGWIPLGNGYVPVSLGRVTRNDALGGSATKVAVGYVHNLSKRTALYASYASISNKNGMALGVNAGVDAGPAPVANGGASGFDIGLRHAF